MSGTPGQVSLMATWLRLLSMPKRATVAWNGRKSSRKVAEFAGSTSAVRKSMHAFSKGSFGRAQLETVFASRSAFVM
jgi:hypothetical protein